MGFFSKLTKAAIDTVLLPVAIVKDVATLGGAAVGRDEPYTVEKAKEIQEDIEEAKEEL